MGMNKDQIADEAKHLESVAHSDPENFAKVWEKEAQTLHASSADMKAIRHQIENDQKKDTSGTIPHIEFYDSGAVKSVDTSVYDTNMLGGRMDTKHSEHVEFDKSTHNKRAIDTVDSDQNVKSHATFDRDGKPLQYDAVATKTGGTEHIAYDAKTHNEVLHTVHNPGILDIRDEHDGKTGAHIRYEQDNPREHDVIEWKNGKVHHEDKTDKTTGKTEHILPDKYGKIGYLE